MLVAKLCGLSGTSKFCNSLDAVLFEDTALYIQSASLPTGFATFLLASGNLIMFTVTVCGRCAILK